MMKEIQNLLRSFNHIKIQYITRSCNAIAHSLAKLALERCENFVWTGSYPAELMYLFASLS